MPSTLTSGSAPGDEMADRLERDVGGEQKELDRDKPLGALFRGAGEQPVAREPPHDHEARDALDGRVDPEAD
jgi:hypothetical protein